MRIFYTLSTLMGSLLLSGCITKGTNPADPYESINRNTHAFNMAFDSVLLKPTAKVYKAVIPTPVRMGVNNVFCNINMLPTVANDLLQADFNQALKDTWRFISNSTFGIAGIFDIAESFGLPRRSNDLGLTFAKWGDKKSPYIVIPFLGPSTIRDGMGMMFDYALFTPYPYVNSNYALYSILVIRYIDLRAQMLDSERLLDEALDKYSFIRDAYLQHRNYLITGEEQATTNDDGALYIDDDTASPKPPLKAEPAVKPISKFPLTSS